MLAYTLCETDVIPAPNGVILGKAILVCSFPFSKLWASAAGREEELYGRPPEVVPSGAVYLHSREVSWKEGIVKVTR